MSPTSNRSQSLHDIAGILTRRSFFEVKRTIDECGLSLSQFITLIRLHYGDPCGVSDMSKTLGITKSAASQIFNYLIRWGYIYRIVDVIDRRKKMHYLTADGQAIVDKSVEVTVLWLDNFIDTFTCEEVGAFGYALETLIRAASRKEIE